ncbi:MAG: thioesterase family protein [Rikenellaceae bacterium]
MRVEKKHTALEMGSGDMEVFATPCMVALMENAAMNEAAKLCDEGMTTVGIMINVAHNRATPLGDEVSAVAELVAQEGRKLTFKVIASDSKGEIGCGTHQRFIVEREKFLGKL